jgi:hypothetical protein
MTLDINDAKCPSICECSYRAGKLLNKIIVMNV